MSEKREAASGFSNVGHVYDSVRPNYKAEALQYLASLVVDDRKCDKDANARKIDLLELGCGSGMFTKSFIKYLPKVSKTSYTAMKCIKTYYFIIKFPF